ncbi:MAG TPA: chemotaxis protein CheB [Methylocystis sp.]|jgi:two-component system CheB/CheR fusion protein
MASESPFPIVGIGASAGGLRALEQFFETVTADLGMAFVIITHLAPDRESFLTDILARHTSLTVHVASDGQKVEPNSVYVLPPNASLTISGGALRLRQIEHGHSERSPVDVFFSSLAQECGEYAVGIVLSGSGSDGVLGIKAIKEQGGLVLAQSSDGTQPSFSGMPDSAIASGLVDFAVPVEDMAAKLAENRQSIGLVDALAGNGAPVGDHPDAKSIEMLYAVLRTQMGHDFSGYKKRTFIRRVHRRMQINHCDTLKGYVDLLQRDHEEPARLFRDLLINVTSFFRDAEAFDAFEKIVVPRLFERRGAADTVRVWVPGCSTGEEVYSIAILLREHMDKSTGSPRVTVFATDIDERALSVARAARYPPALMKGVSPERRERYFTNHSGSFVVAKAVRDLCVFSVHSVLRDPPFSRMDLISCRNLLIYFGADAQRQALPTLHYALRPGGLLFLGKAETIGRFSEMFAPVDKANCIFQSRDTGVPARMPAFINGLRPAPFLSHRADHIAPGGMGARQSAEARIADRFGPPHVIVNEDGDILHYSARTAKYLEAPYGVPSRQLLTSARKELRLDLRSALREAVETRRVATRDNIAFESAGDHVEHVSLTIEPLPEGMDGRPSFLVAFEEKDVSQDRSGDLSKVVQPETLATSPVEAELRDTRERLQGTIEEYETALEELKSANEELVSLNEEFQSSNEELESTKEELQSLNEELQTVNQELWAKVEDLDRANSDLTNLFASTNVATIFLDRDLVIRSFTPAVTSLFNIIATDKGRPLGDLAIKLDYPELQDDIKSVMRTGTLIERRVNQMVAGTPHFLSRLTAYRNTEGKIDGVVATFVDVTSLARSEERQRTLVAELNHRVKNIITVILALAKQTLTRTQGSEALMTRLYALARSHELLARESYGAVSLEEVVRQALAPYFSEGSQRLTLSGPAVALPPKVAMGFGMILDELATNAVKYGALSNSSGNVSVDWSSMDSPEDRASTLTLRWREDGGPRAADPKKRGFGLTLIDREVSYGLAGSAAYDFGETGFSGTFKIPLKPRPE